jgi:superfamily II DNA or RNA helicase
MENIIKGTFYEIEICDYINRKPNTIAWRWSYIPETVMLDSGMIHDQNKNRLFRLKYLQDPENNPNPLMDTGVDILQREYDEEKKQYKYSLVQCKNGYKSGITMQHLAGFMYMFSNHPDKDGIVYYTSRLNIHVKEGHINPRLIFIKKPSTYVPEIQSEQFNHSYKSAQTYTLYGYQKIAVHVMKHHFNNNLRGILSCPCGTGKTIMSCYFSRNYQNVILISPLRQHAEQNMDKYMTYFNDYVNVLIDTDGTRNIDKIIKLINDNKNKKILFSATFMSVDVINKFHHLLPNCIVIVDEFHGLSKNSVFDKDNEMNKLLTSKARILFMSATPRIYELETYNKANNLINEYKLEKLFGPIVYKMSNETALARKLITDCRYFIPSITEDYDSLYESMIAAVPLDKIKSPYWAKSCFIMKGMLDHGGTKIIIYCETINAINEMVKMIEILDKYYYGLDIEIYTITGYDFHSKTAEKNSREWKIKQFEETTKRTVILSVQILDECIDIPKCDGVYISHNTYSKVRTEQRKARCTRIDKLNCNKVGLVFIWCEDYNQILNTLSGIKEYDSTFREKITIQQINMERNKKSQEILENDIALIGKYIVDVKEFKPMSWDDKRELVEQYVAKYDKLPSHGSKIFEDRQLGIWVANQRSAHTENKLTQHQIDKLIKIKHWKWTDQTKNAKSQEFRKYNWSDKYKFVKEYAKEFNGLPTTSHKDDFYRQLGSWCSSMRQKKDTLSQAEIDKLESMNGWFWSEIQDNKIIRTFEESYGLLKTHLSETNEYPTKHTNLYLYSWLRKMKEKYRKNKLDPKRVQMLEILPNFKWKDDDLFYPKFNDLNKWVKKYDKIPSDKATDKVEKPLGRFATHCRQMRKVGKLSAEKIALLDTQIKHWYWGNQDKIVQKTFDEWFVILTDWFKTNENMPIITSKNIDEKELASWCCNQRQKHKQGKLTPDQITKLSKVSDKWFWSEKQCVKRPFNEWRDLLHKWYETNIDPPRQHGDTAEEKAIAGWSNNQRKKKRQNKLSTDQIATLEKIPKWHW